VKVANDKYLWKSLKKGCVSSHNNFKWRLNKWYKVSGDLSLCNKGFHASSDIISAMKYVDCEVLAKVEVRGHSIIGTDKQCWQEMRIIKKWIWKKEDSVRLAIFSANLVLNNFEKEFPNDKRPRQAIKAARFYLKAKDKKQAASAASAARSAAWSAAESAAESARSAARSAAWSEVKAKCHNFIIKLLSKKETNKNETAKRT